MAATANVKTIFARALEIESEAQREVYLQQACQDRPEVRAEVEDLLRNLELAGAFMQTPVPADPPTLDYLAPAESTGTTIGPYRLLDKLGEGGFGVVYRAEQQEPLHREVALKIIRPGMGSKDVVARFEAERQTLALMDHTNIARALDAGTTESGSPYFVMELVHGEPITRYCDRHRLSITRRLELFVSVCQAVQHAHHKGIIHRDIKPSNVLVTCEDGEPVVKMIDFGVAKAVRQGPLEATVSVTLGMVGTPLYMSPEQSGGNSVDVDTRSDIYSLGVLLYELLTGSTPLDGKRLSQAGYNELRQAILEDEPVRPSVKVSASTPAEVCAQRQVDARRLSALLRGDLDWIVLKALEKEPARRYASAKDFADDVVRHLADEPVEASPPSTLYQLRKLVRRHRVTVSLVVAALLLGLGFGVAAFASLKARASKAEAQIARQAREKERQARERAEQKARDEKWLRAKVKPELAQLTENRNYSEAFSLAKLALAKFPADAAVLRTWYEVSATWTVITDPPGARVSVRPYGSDKPFRPLGTTPLHRVPVARGVYSWTIEADDYAPMEGCAGPEAVELKRDLDKAGTVPEGMVRVSGSVSTEEMISLEEEVTFFIDRHEVTNRKFKRFVDAGGYQKKQYWEHPFRDGEKTLTFAEAMKRFVDTTTKQPGPATWKNGTYPPGEDDYPVRGVSWYEAAAYAVWLAEVTGQEKALPPLAYWQLASGGQVKGLSEQILQASNISKPDPRAVGARRGVGPYGTCDMAGNVREWCWNAGDVGERYFNGGAWDDPEYYFADGQRQPALDRNERNGFRCAQYTAPPQGVMEARVPQTPVPLPEPISDEVFDAIRRQYTSAAPKKLNEKWTTAESTANYRHDLVTFDAPYSDERVPAHLFLPVGVKPPFQVVVYFPGIGARKRPAFSAQNSEWSRVQFVLEHGRAVLLPFYQETFGRQITGSRLTATQKAIHQVQDIGAALDCLVERRDINLDRVAYLGFSWGGLQGPLMLALEDRFKTGILVAGGFPARRSRPAECHPFHFAQRVTVPVLMINGQNDTIFPLVESQVPLFRALKTPEKDKRHLVFPGGHVVPQEQVTPEALAWLDRYLGPVGPKDAGRTTPVDDFKMEANKGTHFLERNNFAEAEECFRRALTFRPEEPLKSHPETLKVAYQLAVALEKQKHNEEACVLLESTLQSQRKVRGAQHPEVHETIQTLSQILWKRAWTICIAKNNPRDKYDEAVRLARRRSQLIPRDSEYLVAWALMRKRDVEGSKKAMEKALAAREGTWVGPWFVAAMVYQRAGDRQRARDWYDAACDWLRKRRKPRPQENISHRWAAAFLRLPSQLPRTDRPAEDSVALYGRLIAQHPNVARLYECRAGSHGSLRQWDLAKADYRKATDLDPGQHRSWEALGAITLHHGNAEDQAALCQTLLERMQKDDNPFRRMDFVLICSLVAGSKLDRQMIDQEAERAFSTNKNYPFFRLGKGMAAYRCGRYEEALGLLPESGFVNLRDRLLALLFRAMTRQQLGDRYTARQLLNQAQQEIKKQIPDPAGPLLPYQDRPIIWCMVQTALREAEALIAPPVKSADHNPDRPDQP